MSEFEELALKFSILNHVPIGMFLLRNDYTIVFWNRCLEDWTGTDAKDIVGKNLGDEYPHFNQLSYQSRLGIVFDGGPPAIFSSQLHGSILPAPLPDGKLRIQHTTVIAVPADDGKNNYALFSVEDVTDLSRKITAIREAEKANIEKEKLAGVIEMSAAVCHELNQPLMVISGLSDILLWDMEEDHPLYKHLTAMQEQLDKTGLITKKLMNITRYETREYTAGRKIIDIDKSSS